MRVSTVLLPHGSWAERRGEWLEAEAVGFHAAYTYDHLAWREFRGQPWGGAIPTLAAAAEATSTLRLGPMVTSPNFRHPVLLAKDLLTLDDLSGGRLTVGVGAGGSGFDATALGHPAWTPSERSARFIEFTTLLARLLEEPETTTAGRYYAAEGVLAQPAPQQLPHPPLWIAATGPRGLELAATIGQGWITYGATDASLEVREAVAAQIAQLEKACQRVGRDPATIEKVLLDFDQRARPLESPGALEDWIGRCADLGITEVVLHRPIPGTRFDGSLEVWAQAPKSSGVGAAEGRG